MSSFAYAKAAEMFEEYPATGIGRLEYEANWTTWQLADMVDSGVRPRPDTVTVSQKRLVLYAGDRGWELNELGEVTLTRAFETRRPGRRPSKDERTALEAMTPAEFIRSFFKQGLGWEAAPDDSVWSGLLAYAEAYLGPSDGTAARRLSESTVKALCLRAGAEPTWKQLG